MKKYKPNLSKMFDFHTAFVLAMTLLLLRSCASTQARVQHQNQSHENNHNHPHNQQQQHSEDEKSHHRHNHHHHISHASSTTNDPLSVKGDNELTIKANELFSSSSVHSLASTTSPPSKHQQHQRHHSHQQQQQQTSNKKHENGQHLILNSSSLSLTGSAAPFSNSLAESHTHQQEQQHQFASNKRLIPTPLPLLPSYLLSATTQNYKHQDDDNNDDYAGDDDDDDNQRRSLIAAKTKYPLEQSKFSNVAAAAMERDHYQYQIASRRSHHTVQRLRQQKRRRQQHMLKYDNPEYYYYYDEDDDDDDDDDAGDADDDDIDGFIDDTDNNLSDRSYARITRSKLDDDYADDEPYRNAVEEDEMQRDGAPGVLTEQKYLEVGNGKAVQQARERYIQEQKRPRTPHELATEHWQRMIHATKCRKPMPRVIPVSNNTSKRYEPYATILHRCGEDTGCCGSTASICTVKRYEIVNVYVFSYDFNYRKEIEALPLQNHTECHCVNRGSLQLDATMPRGKRSGSWQHLHQQQQQQYQQPQQNPYPLYQHSQRRSDIKAQSLHHSENMLSCHCPRHFSVVEEDVERYAHLPRPHTVSTRKCRCDCLLNNQTCLRFKHGEEGFSLEDRKCVLDHNCKPPVCSFGEYNVQSGRCPSYRSHAKQKL